MVDLSIKKLSPNKLIKGTDQGLIVALNTNLQKQKICDSLWHETKGQTDAAKSVAKKDNEAKLREIKPKENKLFF